MTNEIADLKPLLLLLTARSPVALTPVRTTPTVMMRTG